MREGPLQEKHRKMSEGKPQVYSVKKTCGSDFEDCGKAAQSVPLQSAVGRVVAADVVIRRSQLRGVAHPYDMSSTFW